jgi:hypothetical protein
VPKAVLEEILDATVQPLPADANAEAFRAMPKKEMAKQLDRLFNDPVTQDAWALTAEQRKRITIWMPAQAYEVAA